MNDPQSPIARAGFAVGDLIRHRLFGYRGVVVDVDARFELTDEWYATMARSRPPKDKPWYHVLVHDAAHTTYVAERNLEPDSSREAIDHPLLARFFSRLENGRYVRDTRVN
jgi:heat shock protein HspQ